MCNLFEAHYQDNPFIIIIIIITEFWAIFGAHTAEEWWFKLFVSQHAGYNNYAVVYSIWHSLYVNVFYTCGACVAVLCLMLGLRVMQICVDARGHV